MGKLMPARRILVVDDNVDAAQLVAELLNMQGYIATVAHGGREALAIAEEFLPDVIFLDIGMPDMDGYAVAAALREDGGFAATRIVALTAWGDAGSRARVAAGGFDAHLVKPARLDSLLREAAPTGAPC
jgi:CheY-like chemotaxis protein